MAGCRSLGQTAWSTRGAKLRSLNMASEVAHRRYHRLLEVRNLAHHQLKGQVMVLLLAHSLEVLVQQQVLLEIVGGGVGHLGSHLVDVSRLLIAFAT